MTARIMTMWIHFEDDGRLHREDWEAGIKYPQADYPQNHSGENMEASDRLQIPGREKPLKHGIQVILDSVLLCGSFNK